MKKLLVSTLLFAVLASPITTFANEENKAESSKIEEKHQNTEVKANAKESEIKEEKSTYTTNENKPKEKIGFVEEENNVRFYKNGKFVVKNWVKNDNKWYYFDENGYLKTSQWIELNKKWYYLTEDGSRVENGLYKIPHNNKKAFFKDGVSVEDSWVKIEDKNYYFAKDGYLRTDQWLNQNNKWIYVTEDGSRVENGVYTIPHNNKKAFFKDGFSVENDWGKDEDGNTYFFGKDGYAKTDEWVTDSSKKWYYLGKDGKRIENGWYKVKNDKTSYFKNGVSVENKWINDNNKNYYLDKDGYLRTSQWLHQNNKWLYVTEDGSRVENGIYTIPHNNKKAFFKDGFSVENDWGRDEDGYLYFFGKDGYAKIHEWVTDSSKKWYYLGKSGKRIENGWYTVKNGKTAYFKNGVSVEDKWINEDGKNYYVDSNGYLRTNQWLTENGKWMYVRKDGSRVENGWFNIKGRMAYFENGISVEDQWRKGDDGKDYYLGSNGYVQVEGWVKDDDGKYYYITKWGTMLTDTFVGGHYVGFNGERFDLSKSRILDVPVLSQLYPYYLPMGCEGTSFTMAIRYRGVYGYTQRDINARFPITGDPRTGFIGTPFSGTLVQGTTPTIWPQALMRYTADIYNNVVDLTGSDLGTLLKEIDNGNPVVYWFCYPAGVMVNIWTPNGTVRNSTSMHCVTLVGYDSNYLYYNDPITNRRERISMTLFYNSYVRYGRMAVSVR